MKSALKIISEQTKGFNTYANTIKSNLTHRSNNTPKLRVAKHMRKFPNFKFGKSSIIHYEKLIKNDIDIEKINKGNMNLPVYKYRIDPQIENVK
jgi:hypothetical protein